MKRSSTWHFVPSILTLETTSAVKRRTSFRSHYKSRKEFNERTICFRCTRSNTKMIETLLTFPIFTGNESRRHLCKVRCPHSPCKPISAWIVAKSHRNGTIECHLRWRCLIQEIEIVILSQEAGELGNFVEFKRPRPSFHVIPDVIASSLILKNSSKFYCVFFTIGKSL